MSTFLLQKRNRIVRIINFENRYEIYRAIVTINYAILFSRVSIVNTMTKSERKWKSRRHRV